MDFSTISFGPHDLAGTVSYVLIAISYWLTSIYWLRVAAVVGLTFEILYFALSGGSLHTGIAWNVVFILINLYQIYRLVEERWHLARATDLHLLQGGAFAGLDSLQVARLVKAGTWRDLMPGTVLTQEGQPVQDLYLIVQGQARVLAAGVEVARLHAGSFVGEMAFLSGAPASATVLCDTSARVFSFQMESLRKLVETDEIVAVGMHRILGRDLAQKLSASTAVSSATRPL